MQLGLIGFGEAGQAFAAGWAAEGAALPGTLAPVLAHDRRDLPPAHGARLVSRPDLLARSSVIFCLVTADAALTAAREAAADLAPGTLWFDGNSCAPATKQQAAEVIGAAGGRYVDTAIMAPVHPRRHKTPILVSGPHAGAGLDVLARLNMVARATGTRVGDASSVKMIRSVMVKGLEALFAECFLAARKAGVEGEVMGSLAASHPQLDWPAQGAYNLERMMQHGQRRAAEMREVAQTLRDLGFSGEVTAAVADWHDRIGALGLTAGDDGLWALCDQLLERL